jgi:pyrroloquinoline quinone biosynthesis protein B
VSNHSAGGKDGLENPENQHHLRRHGNQYVRLGAAIGSDVDRRRTPDMIRILVLGTAAGGGVPQWNCNCPVCRRARSGDTAPSSQASLALSVDGEHWFLINASPDLRQQILENPPLHPQRGLRHSPIAGVLLTNGDVDAVAGLLSLREGWPFTLYGSASVLDMLNKNSIFNVLSRDLVRRKTIVAGLPFDLLLPDGRRAGLTVTAFPVAGKVPLYLEGSAARAETIGLEIRGDEGGHFFFVAACAEMTSDLAERLAGAPMLFFDGTLWRDDEMIEAGLGQKTGRRMAHMSMELSIEALRSLAIGRKIFLHINNSNPAWLPESPERDRLRRAGWEILPDRSEILL